MRLLDSSAWPWGRSSGDGTNAAADERRTPLAAGAPPTGAAACTRAGGALELAPTAATTESAVAAAPAPSVATGADDTTTIGLTGPLPPLTAEERRTYEALRRIQIWMDRDFRQVPGSVPGLLWHFWRRRRHRRQSGMDTDAPEKGPAFGLDPLLGLVPWFGDVAGAAVGLAFVARAAPTVSRYTVLRMLANVYIDAVLGVIPLIGDVFDFGFRANERNLRLFERHLTVGAERQAAADRCWLCTVLFGCLLVCALTALAVLAGVILLVLYLTGHLG